MNRTLENLIRELNFMHDFDNIRFYRVPEELANWNQEKAQEYFQTNIDNNLKLLLNSIKHFARGGVIGSAVGFLIGIIVGSPKDYFKYGLIFGVAIDCSQYMFRAIYHHYHREDYTR